MSTDLFVSTAWLSANLTRDDVGVVDASWYLPTMNRDGKAEYAQRHISKAVHFDIDAVRDPANPLPHMMPSPEAFAQAAGAMGLSEDMTIVVYDGAGLFAAPRVRWAFLTMGAKDVRLLHGGLPQWLSEKRPVASGTPTPEPRSFKAVLNAGAIVDTAAVKQALVSGVQVVDARPAPRFRGEAPEPRPGVASGHMPGSFNVPFDQVVKDGKLVEPRAVREAFGAAGVDLAKPIITSCGSGVSAAILGLALESIGVRANALYDGSWAEWGARGDCVVATAKAD
jgi:thiosulfate/3-mercaptopyruvate sulfurtransferase